jgi:putative methyltransferase
VRINALKLDLDGFIQKLVAKGLIRMNDITSLKERQNGYYIDDNITNLLAFHPSYTITMTFADEYSSGAIILQDKASCFPAYLLSPPIGATVLDACAAPGNKTTQLASIVGPTGHVIAIEKDKKRVETLRSMVSQAGASKRISPFYVY